MRAFALCAAAFFGAGLWGCGSKKTTTAPTKAPTTAPTAAPTAAPTPAPTAPPTEAPYNPVSVEEAWNNHLAAFGHMNVDRIAKDYDKDSSLSVFNNKCAGGLNDPKDVVLGYEEYTGVEEISRFFEKLFDDLVNKTLDIPQFANPDIAATNPLVTELPGATVGLVWKTKDDVLFPLATDSFFWKQVSGVHKIMKQNIMVSSSLECANDTTIDTADQTSPITKAWNNHFKAFGHQNLTLIMEDYVDESVINVWDESLLTFNSYKGTESIEQFFDNLFVKIGPDQKGLNVKLLKVEPIRKSVFLVWRSDSHPTATDSFYFSDEGTILIQNIVVRTPKSLLVV